MIRDNIAFILLIALTSTFINILVIAHILMKSAYKQFNRVTLLIATFSTIENVGVCMGPYSHQGLNFCTAQVYIFQIGALLQVMASSVLCMSVYFTVRYREAISLVSWRIVGLVTLTFSSLTLSMYGKTARLFCPYDDQYEIKFNSNDHNSVIFNVFAFITPITILTLLNVFYITYSTYYASSLMSASPVLSSPFLSSSDSSQRSQISYNHKINSDTSNITSSIRVMLIYPLHMTVAILPLTIFTLVTLFSDQHVRGLFIFAVVTSSASGMANGVMYYLVVRNTNSHETEMLSAQQNGHESVIRHTYHTSQTTCRYSSETSLSCVQVQSRLRTSSSDSSPPPIPYVPPPFSFSFESLSLMSPFLSSASINSSSANRDKSILCKIINENEMNDKTIVDNDM